MGTYENGISTRKIILQVSRQLFLEHGFHQTGTDDICRAAHVNRSTIRYHFGHKENLRYEMLWEMFREYRETASQYCGIPEFQLTSAIYLSWCHTVKDPKVRKFHQDYSRDYPVYIPNKPLPTYYRLLYQYIFSNIWPLENVGKLDFSAIYGHLMGQMQLVGSQPEHFSGKELFLHGMKTCILAWNLPEEKRDAFWNGMVEAAEKIPDSVIENL